MPELTSEALFAKFLESLGLSLADRPELAMAPKNVTSFMSRYITKQDPPTIHRFPVNTDSTVSLRGLRFSSMCEHHLLPFFGTIDIAYAPSGQVVGFGGLERTISYFSHQLQLQERLTEQVATFLDDCLQPRGLIVISRARQLCFELNGGTPGIEVTTSARRGEFRNAAVADLFCDPALR